MPGVVRVGADSHIGHASPTPNPFHKTSYATGSPDVFIETHKTVRIGDTTGCGDPAVGSSPDVYANGILVHRLGDATGGHGSWVPNAAATASCTVFANGGVDCIEPTPDAPVAGKDSCQFYDFVNNVCLDQDTDPSADYYVG